MTKHITPRIAFAENVIAKRRLDPTMIIMLGIVVLFVGKQGWDATQQWNIASMHTDQQIQLKTERCLKEYDELMCSKGTSVSKCGELLNCIQEKRSPDYWPIASFIISQLNTDFWLPATIMALIMLFKISNAAQLRTYEE